MGTAKFEHKPLFPHTNTLTHTLTVRTEKEPNTRECFLNKFIFRVKINNSATTRL